MSHRVRKVEYIEGYKLRLYFDDKNIKVVDLANMLKKAKNMLLPLVDIDYFQKVTCDGITICWPNGVDLCPDVLYAMGKTVSLSLKNRKRSPSRVIVRKRSKSRV